MPEQEITEIGIMGSKNSFQNAPLKQQLNL